MLEHAFFPGSYSFVEECQNKTYNSEDSHVVTHRTTNSPVDCLCMAERTGCPVLSRLWSYVLSCSQLSIIVSEITQISKHIARIMAAELTMKTEATVFLELRRLGTS
nr:hypothetical protein CFP56_09566 [Quercus suber]